MLKIRFGSLKPRIPYIKDGTGNCQEELRFVTCACVYKLVQDIPGSFISLRIPLRYKLSCRKNIFSLPTTKYKVKFSLAIKIFSVKMFILNQRVLWLVKNELHNM